MNTAAAVLLAATAAAPLLCPSWASLLVSTEKISNLSCGDNSSWFYVEADYRTWRNVSVRVPRPISGWACSLHVSMSTGSGHQLPCKPARVILVKIESPWLREETVLLLAFGPRIPLRMIDNLLCSGRDHCRATYMLADNAVTLRLYFDKQYTNQSYGLAVPYFYEASFVVTEVTNVCDLASNTGELLVESNSSREYAFAPGTILLPDSVACTRDKEYSLTLRPHIASAHLSVTALACPSKFSCETLLLNGLSCREGETVRGPQPGYSIKLQYTYSDQCIVEYSGFLVSAQVSSFAAPPIPPTPSQPSFSPSNTNVLVTAVVGTFSAAALVVSLVLALRTRQQLRRAKKGQSRAPTAGSTSAGRVSDRASDDSNPRDVAYESLRATDCEQHVYEVMVLTSAERQ